MSDHSSGIGRLLAAAAVLVLIAVSGLGALGAVLTGLGCG